jgi:hypothetical protein
MFSLYRQNKKDDAGKLKPSWRCFYNIYDYDEPDKGIQLWEISYYMFEATTTMDPQRANLLDAQSLDNGGVVLFSDLEQGSTIIAYFKKKQMGNNEYAEINQISFEPREQPYSLEEVERDCYPLDAMLNVPTVEEFRNAFFGIEAPDDEQETPPETAAPSGRSRSRSRPGAQEQTTQEQPASDAGGNTAPEWDKDGEWGQCPAGGSFGYDCNSLPECDENHANSCSEDVFNACLQKKDQLSAQARDPEPPPKKEEEPAPSGRSRGGRSRGGGRTQSPPPTEDKQPESRPRRRRR